MKMEWDCTLRSEPATLPRPVYRNRHVPSSSPPAARSSAVIKKNEYYVTEYSDMNAVEWISRGKQRRKEKKKKQKKTKRQ